MERDFEYQEKLKPCVFTPSRPTCITELRNPVKRFEIFSQTV